MSIAFVAFGIISFVTMPNTVELSICTSARGCRCLSSSRVCLLGKAYFALVKRDPNFASTAYDMTALITCTVLRTAPLFVEKMLVVERKKCPPGLLHAFFI